MTVRTQKPNVFHVCRPIGKAPAPRELPVLRAEFLRWVDMVDVQSAMVSEAALDAFPSERRDEFKFSFPVARMPVDAVTVLVPVVLLAAILAKASLGRLATLSALSRVRPSVGDVAGLSAKLSRAIAKAVRMHRFCLVAMLTNDLNGCGSHTSKYTTPNKRKYFDIACERIDQAQRQARLFA